MGFKFLTLLLIIPSFVFGIEKTQDPIEGDLTTSLKHSKFMPGALGIGLGATNGSDQLDWGRSLDLSFRYFPFQKIGFGAFYQYDRFKNIADTTYNAEGNFGGAELLFKFLEKPFSYVGLVGGVGRINRLNQQLDFYDERQAVYGATFGAQFDVNDAFSLGPNFKYIHLIASDAVDNYSVKLEAAYRFVLY